MTEEIFAEAITWALETFPQLRQVGESAGYQGGFKFGSGSLKYRKMSYEVARFGGQVGVSLLRPNASFLTQVLHPLPPGEHLAINDKWAYKNSKHLPSVAIRETRKHTENFRQFAASYEEEDGSFLFFTLPACGRRIKTPELSKEIDKSFEKEKLFETLLLDEFAGGVGVIGLRLELPYNANTRTFFPHFHGLAVLDKRLSIEDFRTFLQKFIVSQNLNCCSCDASIVDAEHIGKVASYMFKPCLAAYTMTQAGHKKEFRHFVGDLNKRLVRTKGPFAEFIRKTRVASLVDRRGRARTAYEAETENDDQLGVGEEMSKNPRETSGFCDQRPPQNVLYGVSQSITLPGGLKGVWSTVKNFRPSAAGMTNRFGGFSTVDVVNAAALQCWEDNTGKEYSLKEFLRPFASEILNLLEEDNVQYCTISCSAGVINALRDIKEEKPISREGILGPRSNTGFWLRVKAATGCFKSRLDKLFEKIQDWLRR